MFQRYKRSNSFFEDYIQNVKPENSSYSTTTTTFQISDEIIWLEAVYCTLQRDTSASAISAADKVLEAYKQRFCTDNTHE